MLDYAKTSKTLWIHFSIKLSQGYVNDKLFPKTKMKKPAEANILFSICSDLMSCSSANVIEAVVASLELSLSEPAGSERLRFPSSSFENACGRFSIVPQTIAAFCLDNGIRRRLSFPPILRCGKLFLQ
jgi:hypothetical protein